VKKISIMLCVVLLAGHPVPPLAALPMRPIAKWSGALAVLIAAGVIAGSSLKMKRLEKLKRSLSTAALKNLKGNQRWQNQLKLHALENSLESAQFYRSLGIAGMAVGGALAGAGFLWPKEEEGVGDPAYQPLMPGGSGVPVAPDFAGDRVDSALALALRNSLQHQSGRDGPGHSRVDPSLPRGAGVGLLSGSVPFSDPNLSNYVRDKEYLVVPSENKEVVMPVKDESIVSHRVKIVTVPGDGHCLLYSLLFFNWLKDHHGDGIPKKFALQAEQVLFMRRLICNQLQKKVENQLRCIGEEVTLLSGEVDLSQQLPYQFLINRVKDFYTCGVVAKFCSSGDRQPADQLSFEQFQSCFDAAVLLKTFLAGSIDRMAFHQVLDLEHIPSERLNVLEYACFIMSPTCQGKLDNIQKYLKQRVTVHELAGSYMALYREHIACEVPVFPGTDIPKGIDSQYYLGDVEAELLAGMLKTKIYVYFYSKASGLYSKQTTYGRLLGDGVPCVSLVNIKSNHWAPLVVSGSVSVGAGAASGSSIE